MRILVSGGGVAGPALAYWLHRHGHDTTVVERAPELRDGGAAIDFRGSALDVLDRMGMLAEMRQRATGLRAMLLVDDAGAELARLPTAAISGELEVLKADLSRVLHERTREHTEYLFGNTITALRQEPDRVVVDLETGPSREFDLVVGADGLHSRTRRLAFGPESAYVRGLGIYGALFTTDNYLRLDHTGLMFNTPGRSAIAFPARGDTELRVGLSFVAHDLDYDRHDRSRQEAIVAEHFADGGWEVPRLLAEMRRGRDFFFDSSSQVVMAGWSTGRVVLLGDAGYCAAPTAGRGTSQALVGAYLLGGELAGGGDHREAFARYEKRMRDYVERNQAHGRSAARWFFTDPDDEALTELAGEPDDTVELPDYA